MPRTEGGLPSRSRFRPDRFESALEYLLRHLGGPPPGEVKVTRVGVVQGLEGPDRETVDRWCREYSEAYKAYREVCTQTGVKGYKELSLFTFVGFTGGLGLGALLDRLGYSSSAIGEWAVRALSGEGEDVAEGLYVLKSRLRRTKATEEAEAEEENEEPDEEGLTWFGEEAAEAYGTGKVLGMAFPWAVDFVSRAIGIDVRAPEGSYVAYLYSLADQIGANLYGLRHHVRKAGGWRSGFKSYFRDPVMVASLIVISLPLAAVYGVRAAGFRPDELFLAAVEGVLLNLCWVPPLVAWCWDRRLMRPLKVITEKYAKELAKVSSASNT